MENTVMTKEPRKEFFAFLGNLFARLRQMQEEDDREGFNKLMAEEWSDLKRYFSKRLKNAVENKQIPEGKYTANDFTDELYLLAFDRFHDLDSSTDYHLWILKLAEEVMTDKISDEDFNNFFFKNIDNYTQIEWDAMEETFSTDGDGDLVLIEELDDPSYLNFDYTLKDVFVEDIEADFIEELSEKVSQEQVIRHVEMVLRKLPTLASSIFHLAYNQHLEPQKIAQIKQISLEQTISILGDAKKAIRISIKSRFGNL